MDVAILHEILRGGADKLRSACVTLLGGHSVEDSELKYGLAVTGIIDPKKIIRNKGALTGDAIILTKPLGTGIINLGIKANMVSESTAMATEQSMAQLNATASRIMQKYSVHSATDVTGFGFLGHLFELLQNSNVCAKIMSDKIPWLPQTMELAAMGIVPTGAYRNRKFWQTHIRADQKIHNEIIDGLYDAQTSGGLLIIVAQEYAQTLVTELHQQGITSSAIVGEIISGTPSYIDIV